MLFIFWIFIMFFDPDFLAMNLSTGSQVHKYFFINALFPAFGVLILF
jgi:hypothetical protein